MAFKIVTLVALVASVNAGVLAPAGYEGRLAYEARPSDADYDANPQYSYAYDVQDSLTGDYKQQQESRSGDSVQGSYSLIEADGTRRIVEYTADPENGFNAVIRKEDGLVRSAAPAAPAPVLVSKTRVVPTVYSAPIAKVAPAAYAPAPAVYAAPAPAIAKVSAAPIAYAAPITHVSYSKPLFSYSH